MERRMNMRPRMIEIAHTGQRGVALFFIVSAFTLFLSYDNRRDEQSPRPRNFFLRHILSPARRCSTSQPWVSVSDSSPYLPGHGAASCSLFFLHGLSSTAIGHGAVGGWSVADEALFYMLLPFLLFAYTKPEVRLRLDDIRERSLLPVESVSGAALSNARWILHFSEFFSADPVFLFGIVAYFTWKEVIAPSSMSIAARKNLSLVLLIADNRPLWRVRAIVPDTSSHSCIHASCFALYVLLIRGHSIVTTDRDK